MSFWNAFKRTSLFHFIYRLKFLVRAYHFLVAFLGALIYWFPSREIFVIGVTGTKGKTTVLEVLRAMLKEKGAKVALASSLYFAFGNEEEKNLTNNTMPGRMFIQKFLRRAVREKCEYALIEVTSEGIMMSRHRFIRWRTGVLTNLAPEHIEAHGSFENYRAAKLKFLEKTIKSGGKVFLNADDDSEKFFTTALEKSGVIYFSKDGVKEVLAHIDKNSFLLSSVFLVENLAAAAVVARTLGVTEIEIKRVAENFLGLPGRMEVVLEKPFRVIIDYAHTPDSLQKVYSSLGRPTGKLICVLGSAGGGRDKWKRSKMGEVAERFCSEIVLTNEDPYDDDPAHILRDIAGGIKTKKVFNILDRRGAIEKAVGLAQYGDTVVITGKGSEPFIHIACGKRIPWSDVQVAKETIHSLLAKKEV